MSRQKGDDLRKAGRLVTVARGQQLDPVRENALHKRSMRELNEIKKAEAERRLVPVDEIEPAWGRIMTAIRAQVLGVPGRLRFRLPHLTDYDGQVAEEVCRDALEAAADEAERTAGVDDSDAPAAIRHGAAAPKGEPQPER